MSSFFLLLHVNHPTSPREDLLPPPAPTLLSLRRESMGLDLAGPNVPLRPPPAVDPRRLSLYLPPTYHTTSPTLSLPYTHPSPTLSYAYPRRPPRRLLPPTEEGGGDYCPPHRMTDSLSEIQGDIQRLSSQQQQIQGLMRNGQQQFYLHDQVIKPSFVITFRPIIP